LRQEKSSCEARLEHLKKVSFHSTITADRIDEIIHALYRVRKAVLRGRGIKNAAEANI
jgi:hypothetical protein